MLETIFGSFTTSSIYQFVIPITLAILSGGLIGIEREYRDKNAGFRTMILIALGSCLFTIFSNEMANKISDVTRIASSIVAGIGFLGAGVIMKDGLQVRGITTAASIWLVAALGMGSALGMYALVMMVTVIALLVLLVLPPFERWLDRKHDFSQFHITIKNLDKEEDKILDLFDDFGVEVVELRHSRIVKGERILHIRANMTVDQREQLGSELVADNSVIAFEN